MLGGACDILGGEQRGAYRVLVRKPEGKGLLERSEEPSASGGISFCGSKVNVCSKFCVSL